MIPCLFLLQLCLTKTYIMKKKYILLLTGIVITCSATAQFTKGDRVLGAGLSIQHNAYESNASSFPYTSKPIAAIFQLILDSPTGKTG